MSNMNTQIEKMNNVCQLFIIKEPDTQEFYKLIKQYILNDDKYSLIFHLNINKLKIEHKFLQLNTVLSNIFLSPEEKDEILKLFCKMQRFIHSMYKFKHVWKFKRAKIYNSEDLYMNPIQIGDKGTAVILQNNMKYVFHIRDLIGSVKTSLANSSHFFAEPIVCKNPYTNLPFDKSSLYNIYFAIRESTFLMPVLFHQYFLSGFHLADFSVNNEYLVNDEYLKTYVENNCCDNVHENVHNMMIDYKINIRIHKEFPKDVLFKIMKPYLELYFYSQYSMNETKKEYVSRILYKKLIEFLKYNRNFGRKRIEFISREPFKKPREIKFSFNNYHLSFNSIADQEKNQTDDFMKSHLYKRTELNTVPFQLNQIGTHTFFDTNNRTPVIHPTGRISQNHWSSHVVSHEYFSEEESDEDEESDDSDDEVEDETDMDIEENQTDESNSTSNNENNHDETSTVDLDKMDIESEIVESDSDIDKTIEYMDENENEDTESDNDIIESEDE